MAAQPFAWADVWGWVDDQGTAHFAAEKVDERYQIFFREGESYDTRELAAPGTAAAAPAGGSRIATFFDISPGYKAVRQQLRTASRTLDVDYELLQALIVTESGFNAGAVSPKGAVGLMQVLPATAMRYGVSGDPKNPVARKLVDPGINIHTGTRYLRYLLDLFPGQLELALAAYNAGEGAVQRAGNRIPNFPETQNYVKTVLQIYRVLKPGGGRSGTAGPSGAPQRVRMEIPGRIAGRGNLPPGAAPPVAAGALPIAAATAENAPLP